MKRLILILSLICLTIPGLAEQISRDQALRKAQQFLSQKGLPSSVKAAETALSRRRAQGIPQPDYYYVFNNGQNQGFVIVSGDDRAETVLGYATSGSFDVDRIPSNMAAWLQDYADQIKWIQDHNIQPRKPYAIRRAFASVAPIVTSEWNQFEPYNNECPTDGSEKCVTGCVTTAVSQILYHYSKNGFQPTSTAIPGYSTKNGKFTLPDLPATSFDWANMIDKYDGSATQAQNDAVAKLFQYVGTGLEANYDIAKNGGTAVWDNMPEIVFKNYFGYGSGIELIRRADAIPESEWDNLIYNEIANGRPVLYSGQGTGGGHSFIVHGYDGAGKYLINWGWGGYQDAYFALSALDPDGGGAGAGDSGYNYDQTALVGISPDNVDTYTITVEETPVLSAFAVCVADPSVDLSPNTINPSNYTEYTGTRDANGKVSFAFKFAYGVNLYNSYTFNMGFVLMKDGEVVNNFNFGEASLPGGNYSFNYSGTLTYGQGIPNGDYQLKLAYKLASASDWSLCEDADNHIINVRVTDTQIMLKVGDLSPTPEVTQADLDNLTTQYAAQKMAIETKLAAIADNEMRLSAVAQTLTKKTNALSTIDAKIASLEEKLKSEYLTAEQKQSYTNQLNEIKAQSAALLTQINSANSELESLQSKGNSLKSTLNGLLTSSNTQAAAVASITTKADLETSQAKLAEITTQLSACDVSSEASKITALESSATTIGMSDTSGMSTNLTTLETTIDAAIEAGKNSKDEEAKAKLEEGKKALAESCDKMAAELLEKQEVFAANEKTILNLETQITDYCALVTEVEKYIDAIKEKLNSNMLTAEQKADFESKVETFEKGNSTFDKAVKDLSDALALAKKENENLKSTLNEIDAQIKNLQSAINAITTADALNKAKEDADKVEAQLSDVSVADIEKQLLSVQDNLGKLSLDDISKGLETLNSDVDKAIAGGQEEYEKQQAEKLAKAQENFMAAIDALDETIKAQEVDYNACLEAMNDIKAKMAEVNAAIPQLKAQYAEIEKKLQELIDKRSSTRADDSEVIENLQKDLAELKEKIENLESQSALIAGYIETLERQAKDYADVIAAAKTSRQTLYDALSSATTADEVDKLTASVNKAKLDLASEGTGHYNLLAKNCNAVTDNVSDVVDNVNVVDKTIKIVEMQVEEVVTAINQLIIDESEVVARYDMKGNPVDSTYKGMQIIRLKNGKTIKLNVK